MEMERKENLLMQEMGNSENLQLAGAAMQEMAVRDSAGKKFNLGTILLLATGSIFVAVAAIIFVVKAWPYLGHVEKIAMMVLATAGCFGLSYLAEKKLAIKGSASAMYYLGTALCGITMMAIADDHTMKRIGDLYGLTFSTTQYIQMLLTFAAMFVPMMIRLFKKRLAVDAIFATALLDACVFALAMLITDEYAIISVIFCLVHSAILFAYQRLKKTEERSLLSGLKIVVMIHAVVYFITFPFVGTFWMWLGSDWETWVLFAVQAASFAVMFWYYTENKSVLSLIATLADLLCLTVGTVGMDIPFIPEVIEVETSILIMAAAVWALKPIFAVRGGSAQIVVKYVRFALNCLLMTALLCHNIEDGELVNVLILGVVGAAMLIWSVMRNRREYIILSSVTLVLLVLYVTRDFWTSISWWIYLMIVGIIMIGIAVLRERKNM